MPLDFADLKEFRQVKNSGEWEAFLAFKNLKRINGIPVYECLHCKKKWLPKGVIKPTFCCGCGRKNWDIPPILNTCQKCNYTWTQRDRVRNKKPRSCPNCNTKTWEKRSVFRKCKKCNHEWEQFSVTEKPKCCPKCVSSTWDKERIKNHCIICGHDWNSVYPNGIPKRCSNPKCHSINWKGGT